MAERGRTDSGRRVPLGVVDVGSNTARCVVFETYGPFVRAVHETKATPRLGLAPTPDGRLSDAAFERGVAALARFSRVLAELRVGRVVAVATSAVRDAPNGPEFVRAVEKATGLALRVLSGAEEARYAYLSAAGAWALGDALVFDLGGGSLQLVEVRAGSLRNSVSLPLGALRLSQRFFRHDPPKRHEVDELRGHVRETLSSVLGAFGPGPYRLFGAGGTVRALARASIGIREYPVRRVHGFPLTDHDLEALGELLGEMSAAKRRSIPGIGSDRADIVPAGVVVLEELLAAGKVDRTTVAGTGIREGIALEAAGATLPASSEELAERSVEGAAESLGFRLDRGRAVAGVAVALFELLADRFAAGASERLALKVSAWMHEAGTAIDLWNSPQHSAYVLENFPLRGLEQREVLLASMVAYLHEGDAPPSSWKKGYLPIVGPSDLEKVLRLGAILEVAVVLAAGRPKFALANSGKTLAVSFSVPAESVLPARWAEKVEKPMRRAFGLDVRGRDAT